jgi:hypothetical protein
MPEAGQFNPAAHPRKRWSLLDPAHEKQNDKDNQNDADDPDAAVTVAVSITAEASTESAKQEDDENDDEDQSERHEGCLLQEYDSSGRQCREPAGDNTGTGAMRPMGFHARPSA